MVSSTDEYLKFNPDETSNKKEDDFLTPLVVCGPSGVGKGTIISNYMSKYPCAKKFGFTTSHTTRSPRPGEIDGTDYHFTSHMRMEELIAAGKFLEYANVHGNIYGTSFEAIQHVENNLQKICLLDIDVQGVRSMKRHERDQGTPKLKGNYIFISPPSLETLKTRLMGRGTETKESLERRTKNAQMEMEYGLEKGNFDYIIVNDNLDEACQSFDRVVKEIYGNIC